MVNPSETQASESRIIGKLEGVAESLQVSLGQVRAGQEAARLAMAVHAAEDRTYQERFAEGLGGLRDRVVRLEMGADETEGHGSAILNLEQRMSAREAIEKAHADTAAAVRATNLRWASAAAGVGAVAGSAGSAIWPKIWASIAGLFKP